MKVALVHDSLNVYGGAEKVLEELHGIFPEAPVFTPFFDPRTFPEHIRNWDIRTTWMQRVPWVSKAHRVLFPLYPYAIHGMDLDGYDVVLSSSFNFGHNVVTGPDTTHVCYCHSPARFLWDFNGYARREAFSPLKRSLIAPFLPSLRTQDRSAAQGVDRWISTSRLVQGRIHKLYRQPSTIVPPPIDVREFHVSNGHDGYFLLLMRLVGWKRADIAIEACNALKLPLVVAGTGRDLDRLKAIAGPTVTFTGRTDGQAKADLYARCAALILPSLEDFGITPLEAMASGRPVIALGHGGVLDTVIPGVTGEFFAEQTAESLTRALRAFDPNSYDPSRIRHHAETFDRTHFRRRIMAVIDQARAQNSSHKRHHVELQLAQINPVREVISLQAR